MARLFRQNYTDRASGEPRESCKWYVGVIIGGGEKRVAGFTDKRATTELGAKLEKLAAARAISESPDPALTNWVDGLPVAMRERLADIGLLDGRAIASARPLSEHVADWRQALNDDGCTFIHADKSAKRALAMLTGIGAVRTADVRAADVLRYLADRRKGGLSHTSSNHYQRAVKMFFAWMIRERRPRENPVARLCQLNATRRINVSGGRWTPMNCIGWLTRRPTVLSGAA